MKSNEKQALGELSKRTDILIIKADEIGAIIIQNRKIYSIN